jgi:hypothetical protein
MASGKAQSECNNTGVQHTAGGSDSTNSERINLMNEIGKEKITQRADMDLRPGYEEMALKIMHAEAVVPAHFLGDFCPEKYWHKSE